MHRPASGDSMPERLLAGFGQPASRYALAVAVAGLAATVVATLYQADQNGKAIDAEFNTRAGAFESAVDLRMRTYEYGLRGIRGTIIGATLDGISHEGFLAYTRSRDLNREFPGARGLGFIRRVAADDLATFLERAAADRDGPFRLTSLIAPRSEHWIIQYSEPESRNAPAIGLDIASEPRRYQAAYAAMASGQAQLTAPMTLVQAPDQPNQGFLLLLPIYAQGSEPQTMEERLRATRAWAYAPLLLGEVLADISAGFPGLILQIADATDATDASNDEDGADGADVDHIPILTWNAQAQPVAGRHLRHELPVFGRIWRIDYQPSKVLVDGLLLTSHWVILLIGGVVSLLSSGLTYSLRAPVDRRRQLAAEADAMAHGVINVSPQAIVVANADGVIVQANARVADILGHAPQALIGQPIDILFAESSPSGHRLRQRISTVAPEQIGLRQDQRIRHADGHVFPAEVMLSPLHMGAKQLVVASIIDVTERRQALARLRDSEARWRQLANSMPQHVWTCTPSGQCDFLSEQWVRYTGIEEAVQLGTGWLQQIHPEDREALWEKWASCIEDGTQFRVEFRIRRRDGAYRWFDIQAVPLKDESGVIQRWFGSDTDIEERKQAEKALRELNASLEQRVADRTALLDRARRDLRNILDAMPSMVAYWDRDQINRFANHSYRDWFDVDPEKLPGTSIRELLGTELYAANLPHIEAVLKGEPQQFERRIGTRYIMVRYIPDRHGDDIKGFYAFTTDITEIRRATEAAETANAAKSVFLANMSHEIRTPMNAVLNVAYLLQQTTLDSAQRDLVDKLGLAGRSLMALINDVLDLSKIEAGAIQLAREPFELKAVLDDTLTLARAAARHKRLNCELQMTAGLPDRLIGDPHRLAQVINNLLSNAIKFTTSGSVTLEVLARDPGSDPVEIEFAVTDTGIGIGEDVRDALFRPFVQADSTTTRKFGGTGLGLAIVKRLVGLMGGEVGVSSALGRGSRFWFRIAMPTAVAAIPADSGTRGRHEAHEHEHEHAPHPHRTNGHRLRGRRILVVDDSSINVDIAEKILALEGAITVRAHHGLAALEQLQTQPQSVDAVLMDVHMPVMDGLEAARRIRELPGLARLPIIALTADALVSERTRALDAGMNDFVTKPFEPARLVARLAALLGQPGQQPSRPNAPEPDAGAPDGDPAFDLKAALVRAGDDRHFLATLLQQFLRVCAAATWLAPTDPTDPTPTAVTAVTAQRPRSAKDVLPAAHALSGTAANVGAAAVAAAAARIEHAAKADDAAGMTTAIAECRQAIRQFTPLANSWIAQQIRDLPAATAAEAVTAGQISIICSKLRRRKLDALDDVARLSGWDRLLGVKRAAQLHAALQALDFDAAIRLLERPPQPDAGHEDADTQHQGSMPVDHG